jgi:glycosyltransferase involved in cell wall biosynthesis
MTLSNRWKFLGGRNLSWNSTWINRIGTFRIAFNKSTTGPAVPYLLYVGNQYPYKNLQRLTAAFSELAKRNLHHHVVLAGKKDPRFFLDLQRKAEELDLQHA